MAVDAKSFRETSKQLTCWCQFLKLIPTVVPVAELLGRRDAPAGSTSDRHLGARSSRENLNLLLSSWSSANTCTRSILIKRVVYIFV